MTTKAASTQHGDALRSLLSRAIAYEKAGAPIPIGLLRFGFLGSMVVVATGLLALALPAPATIRNGQFFIVFGDASASLDALMRTAAIPAIVCGVLLLVLDVVLLRVRTSERWRTAVTVQFAAGGAGGVVCVAFLALVLLNFAIWLVIIALWTVFIFVVLRGMIG